MALLITFFLGLFFVLGALIAKIPTDQEKIEHWSIAIAFGAMVALAVCDLVPEVFECAMDGSVILSVILVAAGTAILKGLDCFVPEHNDSRTEETSGNLAHIGIISAVAITIHNLVEGMTVYTIATSSLSIGFSLALGVGLHNIPMGMLIYSTLKKEHKDKKRSILAVTCLSTFLGGLLMWSVSSILTERLIGYLVCIALGMVIYILVFELFPSVYRFKNRNSMIIGTLVGFAVVLLSMFFD